MLLLVTTSVAYLALPKGRLCPWCGAATSPVVLRMALRVLSPWVQWRWCSRCGWEGAGRRGHELGSLDPPLDGDDGFRWADPDSANVPIFDWRPDRGDAHGETQPDPPSGFKWSVSRGTNPARGKTPSRPKGVEEEVGRQGDRRRMDDRRDGLDRRVGLDRRDRRPKRSDQPSGFHFREGKNRPRYPFQWGSNRRRTSSRYGHGHIVKPRPWYLSWLVSRDPPGFQSRSGQD